MSIKPYGYESNCKFLDGYQCIGYICIDEENKTALCSKENCKRVEDIEKREVNK